jgi:predicted MFS family arabinose efflux permease
MKKRHVVLGLLVSLSIVTYMDRICISVAGARIQEQLGISPERWGWVLGAFVLAYGLFEIPSGAMGDTWGQRRLLTRIVVWWSIFTSLTGAAWSFGVLLPIRFLFGAGEAGAYPNMAGSVGRWFPATERARAQGFIWGASRVGGAIAPWLVVPLMAWLGWRAVFFVFGSLGVVWALVWVWWYRDDPRDCPGITETELAELDRPGRAGHAGIPWAQLLHSRQIWLIMAMYWCYVWGSMFYLTWFHTYLVKGRGLSEREMGLFSALPFIAGFAGNMAGGFLCDRFSVRYGLGLGRRLIGSISLATSALMLFTTASTHGKVSGIVLLSLGFGVMDCMLPAAWAICLDVGGKYSGVVSGAMNSAGQFGGFVCSVLFGRLVQQYGNYNLPLFFIATMVFISAILFWMIDPGARIIALEPAGLES